MGSLYTRKDRNAAGVLVPSGVIWIKYRDASGRIVRESTKTDNAQEAKRLLKLREGAEAEGKVIGPKRDKITVAELADDLRAEYAANGRRSAKRLEFSLVHLLPALGTVRAQHLTTAAVTAYTVKRRQAGAANATINRELAALKRLLRLAAQGEKITRVVHISMRREDNVCRGFFEREQFEAVRRHPPRRCDRSPRTPTSRAGGSARSWGYSGTGSTSLPAPCGSMPAPRRADVPHDRRAPRDARGPAAGD